MRKEPALTIQGCASIPLGPRRYWRGRARQHRETHPRLEFMEGRLLLTTLPPGFTESAVVSGLNAPTAMEFAPDGRLFVLEQGGNVKLVRGDGTTWTALHLNVDSQGERGLLGIAFDPGFATNHFVYLYYTNPSPGAAPWAIGEHNQLGRFTLSDTNPQQPSLINESPVLDWNSLSTATNHNGGAIHFGLDGKLYADAGDNVQTFTQGGNTYRVSQTLANLLGKQLRIDVSAFNSGVATRDDTTVGHLIPADNPFVGKASGINQLIYALGLRNPYTFAVQPGTGKIFINDVGETTWEEIDQSVAGGNYGWSGGNTDGFNHPNPPGPGTYQDPLLAYNHSGGPAGGGIAIVGGAFYNPTVVQFPSNYVGKYFYADLGAGWIRVFDPSNPGSTANPDTSTAFATGTPGALRDLKVDSVGNLYYLSGNGGVIEKISYQAPQITPQIVAQPTNQTVNQGGTATFTAAATGPALSYQWQHLVGASWTNLGTNAPTLTLPNVSASDTGSYRVNVSNAFGSVTSGVATLTVNVVLPAPAQGLIAQFFDLTHSVSALPNLSGTPPTIVRIDANINYAATTRAWTGLDTRFINTFASRHTGLLKVDTPGKYTLSLKSDDGSKLFLDGALLINNDGPHAIRERSKTLTLGAGYHSIEVDFFQNTGSAGLILSWAGPGFAKQPVPPSRFFHDPTAGIALAARAIADTPSAGTSGSSTTLPSAAIPQATVVNLVSSIRRPSSPFLAFHKLRPVQKTSRVPT